MFRNSVIGVSNIFPKGSHRENVDPEILRIDHVYPWNNYSYLVDTANNS